jgi:hypothetical protein
MTRDTLGNDMSTITTGGENAVVLENENSTIHSHSIEEHRRKPLKVYLHLFCLASCDGLVLSSLCDCLCHVASNRVLSFALSYLPRPLSCRVLSCFVVFCRVFLVCLV